MNPVQTVRGTVDAADLGRTLMHEHVFILSPDVQQNFPEYWGDEDERVADAVARLREVAAAGYRTVVDLTVLGMGRYIPRIQRVAEQVPELNILVASGVYTHGDVPSFFAYRGPVAGQDKPEPMVDMFEADVREGIGGTGVKAAVLKCAIDHAGLTPGVERVMLAVAETHRRTGTPITVHTHPGSRTGLVVKRILVDEGGADPSKIVLGHSGDSSDVDHLTELAEAGFLLGMDRMGVTHTVPFEQRCDVVVEMCRRGFAEHLVLSHDAACYIDWTEPGQRERLPQWHYLHIEQDVLPYLRKNGVTEEQITTMVVDNPRRYFESR